MRKAIALWCLLFLPGALPAQLGGFTLTGPGKSKTIPIEIYNNLILVQVCINHSFPMHFILDTGVRTTILTEPLLMPLLGINADTVVHIRGLGQDGAIPVYLSHHNHLSLLGAEHPNADLIIIPEESNFLSRAFGKPVYGIIGAALFESFAVEINYRHKVIRLQEGSDLGYRNGTELPLQMLQDKPYLEVTLKQGSSRQSDKRELLIDLGASQALMLPSDSLTYDVKSIPAYLGQGLSGEVSGQVGRVDSFILGPYAFTEVVAGIPDTVAYGAGTHQFTWEGSIGAELWRRFKVTLDYRGKRILLKKYTRRNKPFYFDLSGITLVAMADNLKRLEIHHIRNGSAADEAGLQVGDEVKAINGREVSELELNYVYHILNRKPGSRICMQLMRNGDRIKRCIRTREDV